MICLNQDHNFDFDNINFDDGTILVKLNNREETTMRKNINFNEKSGPTSLLLVIQMGLNRCNIDGSNFLI